MVIRTYLPKVRLALSKVYITYVSACITIVCNHPHLLHERMDQIQGVLLGKADLTDPTTYATKHEVV